MKWVLIFIICSISSTIRSQPTKLLLLETDSVVNHYFDSLLRLKTNPNYRVEHSTDEQGDLVLSANFALADAGFYKCTGTKAFFSRIDGKERCMMQLIWGNIEYAQVYLTFIKDKFTKTKENTWELDLTGVRLYNVIATFEKRGDDQFAIYFSMGKQK